jgi:hypothetical protein
MTTYSLKTKLTETEKLTLDHLPFDKGDEIEITIIQTDLSKSNVYSLKDSQPYRYDDPFEPATSSEDWDVLQRL